MIITIESDLIFQGGIDVRQLESNLRMHWEWEIDFLARTYLSSLLSVAIHMKLISMFFAECHAIGF